MTMKRERFREGRLKLGMTQAGLAKAWGVRGGGRTVRKWERGENSIPSTAVWLMAIEAFGERPFYRRTL